MGRPVEAQALRVVGRAGRVVVEGDAQCSVQIGAEGGPAFLVEGAYMSSEYG
ncbi:hypothetical protein ABZ858_29985 [Streptomyces sp. NPDC047017]|uniref:hypothetical protein n=1 Tax=Streptomyces sp. NPDC047017 TaxID=3155024 RepID=UPI00340081C3